MTNPNDTDEPLNERSIDHLTDLLYRTNQDHILSLERPLRNDILRQLNQVDEEITGGLYGYMERAGNLLKYLHGNSNGNSDLTRIGQKGDINITRSKVNGNSLFNISGCKLSNPLVDESFLDLSSDAFSEIECMGRNVVGKVVFCLVAGGLGERLGHDDIKVSLIADHILGMSYLEWYCTHIKEMQYMGIDSEGNPKIPLVIMTSEDTHERTLSFLKENNYFDLDPTQVSLLRQRQVPSFDNSNLRLSLKQDRDGNPSIITKPHGHGDIHSLLCESSLIPIWQRKGKDYIIFFQDTNCLAMRAVIPMLGKSLQENADINFLSVPRVKGEASGIIVKIESEELIECGTNQKPIICNLEYHLIESVGDKLKSDGSQTQLSNVNCILFKLNKYKEALEKTNGKVPEHINPKINNSIRSNEEIWFLTAARLECMLQDFAAVMQDTLDCRITVTLLPRWYCFSCVKNDWSLGIRRQEDGLPPETSLSAFFDLCHCNVEMLRIACKRKNLKFSVSDENKNKNDFLNNKIFNGWNIFYEYISSMRREENSNICSDDLNNNYVNKDKNKSLSIRMPLVSIHPRFGCTIIDLIRKLEGNIEIHQNSILILEDSCLLPSIHLSSMSLLHIYNNNNIIKVNADVLHWRIVRRSSIGIESDINKKGIIEIKIKTKTIENENEDQMIKINGNGNINYQDPSENCLLVENGSFFVSRINEEFSDSLIEFGGIECPIGKFLIIGLGSCSFYEGRRSEGLYSVCISFK